MALDRETGAVTSLRDRQTGREWLAPGGGSRLYEIVLARPGAEPLRLSLAQATGVRVRRSYPGEIQVSADSHGETRLGVRLTFAVDADTGLLTCRMSVRNDTDLVTQLVRFPLLGLPIRLGATGEDDRLLLPHCDGLEIYDPERHLRGTRAELYPGGASMQCLAFYDTEGGLYAAILDREGHRKRIGAAREGETLEPVLTHLPVLEPRADWTLPYAVTLGAFMGDWQVAAGMYRAWAEHQPWCETPLRKRRDIPAWALQPSFYYVVSLRGDAPGSGEGDRLAQLAANVAEYRATLGIPVVSVLTGWEKHGPWVAPDYFPPVGGDAGMKALTAALHRDGGRAMLFLSGLRWTLRKTFGGTDFSDPGRFTERGRASAVVGEDGQPQRFGRADGDVGEYAEICPATPLAHEMLTEAARLCQELGVDCVQVDQMVGGGTPICYTKEHRHPPGGGAWSARAVYALFDEVRKQCRARNPEFMLLMEEPGEYFIPVLDAYHARDYMEGRWPRHGAGVRGVPLFTYVYHEYCLGYGGDSAPLTPQASATAAYAHGLNLVNGKMPAGAVWGRWHPAARIHPDQTRLLRNWAALLGSPAGEYLIYGRRVPAGILRSEALPLTFPAGDGQQPEERPYPAILHTAYSLPEGRVGRVFLNMASERKHVEVTIPATERARAGQRLRLTCYRAENGRVTQETETVQPPILYPLSLSPLEPVVVETIPAGWDTPK